MGAGLSMGTSRDGASGRETLKELPVLRFFRISAWRLDGVENRSVFTPAAMYLSQALLWNNAAQPRRAEDYAPS